MTTPAVHTTCANCHSTMPSELRFCRNCGFRLSMAGGGYTAMESSASALPAPKPKRRISGMTWIFICLLVFFVGAAAFTALMSPVREITRQSRVSTVKSFVGVSEFKNTDQGLMLDHVNVPGGPADLAGLLGGDLILKFDGQPVQNEDQLEELMVKTPIGKTVEVEFLRDGEKKTTQLTTISQEENRRLYQSFRRRPEGWGSFGYDNDDTERVLVPGTNNYGVRLDDVSRNLPADIAGVKNGDIVVEFDGVPIRTPDELLMRVRRAVPYNTIKLVIVRGEAPPLERVEIQVKMGKR